jgi:hypothetical protein
MKKILENRRLYRIRSRNLNYGIYDSEKSRFIGIREKINSRFIDSAYIPEDGIITVIEALDTLPEEISLKYAIGNTDITTGRYIDLNKEGKWFFLDNNEQCDSIKPALIEDEPIFKWLDKFEQKENVKTNQL